MYQYIPFTQNQHKLMEFMGVTKVLIVFVFTYAVFIYQISLNYFLFTMCVAVEAMFVNKQLSCLLNVLGAQ